MTNNEVLETVKAKLMAGGFCNPTVTFADGSQTREFPVRIQFGGVPVPKKNGTQIVLFNEHTKGERLVRPDEIVNIQDDG
jgi:hypothetical protein